MARIKSNVCSSCYKLCCDRKQIHRRSSQNVRSAYRRFMCLPLCRRKDAKTTIPLASVCRGNSLKDSNHSLHSLLHNTVCSQPMKRGRHSNDNADNYEKKSSMVHFHDKVTIVHIQSHRDYSKSKLKRLYSTRKERLENKKRNKLEFLADGKDWRTVLEEDAMLINDNGEFLHPVHRLGLRGFRKKKRKILQLLKDEEI